MLGHRNPHHAWTDSRAVLVQIDAMTNVGVGKHGEAISLRMRALRIVMEDPKLAGTRGQADFARWLDINKQTWGNYEKSGLRPGLNEGHKIAERTGVTLDWIYTGDPRFLPLHLASRLEETLLALAAGELPPQSERRRA